MPKNTIAAKLTDLETRVLEILKSRGRLDGASVTTEKRKALNRLVIKGYAIQKGRFPSVWIPVIQDSTKKGRVPAVCIPRVQDSAGLTEEEINKAITRSIVVLDDGETWMGSGDIAILAVADHEAVESGELNDADDVETPALKVSADTMLDAILTHWDALPAAMRQTLGNDLPAKIREQLSK